jgi:hypothetical protein
MLDIAKLFTRSASGKDDQAADPDADLADDGPVYARLSVKRGRHAGASLDLTRPEMSIGSAMSSDVVLTDADIKPNHLILVFLPPEGAAPKLARAVAKSGNAATVTIEAAEGAVLAGIEQIEPGRTADVALPATLRLGDCEIELTRPKARAKPWTGALGGAKARRAEAAPSRAGGDTKRGGGWLAPMLIGGVGLASALAAGMMLPKMMQPPKIGPAGSGPAPRASERQAAAPVPAAAPEPAPVAKPAPPAPPPRAAPSATMPATVPAPPPAVPLGRSGMIDTSDPQILLLRQHLQQAGLGGSMNIGRRGAAVIVEGTVGSDGYSKWATVKQAFAAAGNDPRNLVDLVKTSTAATLPRNMVASIVLGRSPYVVSGTGRRAKIGEQLEDGWTVDAVTAQAVTLRRGATIATVNPADGELR